MTDTILEIVREIRNAKTEQDAADVFNKATTPKRQTNKPPEIDDVLEFARDRAAKDGEDISFYLIKAEEAFNYYSSNMEIMGAKTWKDGNGVQVKNWKLKIYNNWMKQRA